MGNCTGYCISDQGPDAKRKITVEQKEGETYNQNNQVYINEQRQEFEIEYGNQGEKQRMGSQGKTGQYGQTAAGGYIEPNDKLN